MATSRWEDKGTRLVFEGAGKKPVKLTRSQSVSLKGCPFCAAIPFIERWHGGGPRKHMVACINDFCNVNPQTTGETLKETLENWNTRSL